MSFEIPYLKKSLIHQEKLGLINKEASFMRPCWHNVWCTRVPQIMSFALIWLQELQKGLSSLDWYAGTHLAQVNQLDFVGGSKIMLQAASSFRFPGDLLLTNSGEMGNAVSWKFRPKIHTVDIHLERIYIANTEKKRRFLLIWHTSTQDVFWYSRKNVCIFLPCIERAKRTLTIETPGWLSLPWAAP